MNLDISLKKFHLPYWARQGTQRTDADRVRGLAGLKHTGTK
jgi:hypothetical protein